MSLLDYFRRKKSLRTAQPAPPKFDQTTAQNVAALEAAEAKRARRAIRNMNLPQYVRQQRAYDEQLAASDLPASPLLEPSLAIPNVDYGQAELRVLATQRPEDWVPPTEACVPAPETASSDAGQCSPSSDSGSSASDYSSSGSDATSTYSAGDY